MSASVRVNHLFQGDQIAISRLLSLLLMFVCVFPVAANASLLGRLNIYGSGQPLFPDTPDGLLKLRDKLSNDLVEKRKKVEELKSKDENHLVEDSKIAQDADLIEIIQSVLDQQSVVAGKFDALQKATGGTPKSQDAIKTAQSDLDAEMKKLKKLQGRLSSLNTVYIDETENGVFEGIGEASLINQIGSNTNPSIALNAYRFNVLLGYKKRCGSDDVCGVADAGKYNSIPMYLFLKKSVSSQVNATTFSNDLLDTEHGGAVHIKFSKAFRLGGKWFTDSSDPQMQQMKEFGGKGVLDFGIKLIETPTLAAATNTTATNGAVWSTSGYVGLGYSVELPIFTSSNPSKMSAGEKPAGAMALGVGYYQNFIDPGQFDSTLFASLVPSNFTSAVLMYEMQITNLFSVKGTRVVPVQSSMPSNPLNGYSSFQLSYKF